MLTRLWPVVLFVFALSAPSTLRAQVVEEDDTEILKPVPLGKAPPKSPSVSEAVLRIIALTNEFREQERLERVEINPQLQKAAQYFSGFMARTNRYGHKADGATPADRAKKFGYEYCIIAENIGYAYSSAGFTTEELAQEFFEGWKASPGHRRNMLDPDVTETAVAITQGAESGYFFAVQMFGRPKAKAVEFAITNDSPTTVQYKMGERTLSLPPGHTRTHQVCRIRDMAFRWPDAEGEGRIVQPSHGDHFVVTKEGQTLQLRKE